MSEKNLPALNETGQVAVWDEVPEELLQGDGFQEAESSDYPLPRLSIAQALSPQLKKTNANYIDGLQQGDFFNTVTKKVYGNTIRVIPVYFNRNRILYNDNKEIECRSDNGKTGGHFSPFCSDCEYSKWQTSSETRKKTPPPCTEFKNFILYIPEDDDLAIFSFKKGSIAVGGEFLSTLRSQVRLRRTKDGETEKFKLPMWGAIYELNSFEVSGLNPFFTIQYKLLQDVVDKKLRKYLLNQENFFKQSTVKASTDE